MNARMNLNILTQVFATADRVGATLPKRLRDDHAKLAALADKVRTLDAGHKLPEAILDALAADHDIAADATVQQEAVRNVIAQVSNGVEPALAARVGTFLQDNAEALVAALVEPFDKAAAELKEAVHALGDADLNDPAAVLGRGGDAAQHWANAQRADQVIHQIRTTRQTLANVHRAYQVDPRYKLLTYVDVPADRFIDDELSGVELRGWQAVHRGLTLSLATPATLRGRVEAVRQETERRALAYQNAPGEAWARSHRVGA